MLNTADLTDAMGQKGNLVSAIQSRVPGASKLVGVAYTVRTPPGDFLAVMRAYDEMGPDDVMVVDGGGYTEAAIIGELVCGKGKGIVVDGAVRDIKGIREMNYPLFSRAVTPRAGKAASMGEVQITITCGGVTVKPGDVVVGDEDGVAVVPAEHAEEVAENIKPIEDREYRIKQGGEDMNDVYGLRDVLKNAPRKSW